MPEMKVFDIPNKFIIPANFKVIVRKDKYFEVYRDTYKNFYDEMYISKCMIDGKPLNSIEVKSIIVDYEISMLIIKI